MQAKISLANLISWVLAAILLVVGVLNMALVHPVPGMVYLLLSFVYAPPANAFFKRKFNFKVPLAVKLILFIPIVLFTLGVSDLGDMLD